MLYLKENIINEIMNNFMLKPLPVNDSELLLMKNKFNAIVMDMTKGLYEGDVSFSERKGGLKFKVNAINDVDIENKEFVIEL